VAAAQAELLQLLQQQAAGAAAFEQTTAAAAAGSVEGTPDVVGRGLLTAANISCASRLLPCASFVAAAHKLMWWMHSSMDQHTKGLTDATEAAAAAAAAPVAVLSGSLQLDVSALATTAAAALGATVVRLELLQPGRAEQGLAEAAAAAAAAAASGTAVTVDSDLLGELPAADNATEQQIAQLPDHLAADSDAAPEAAAAAAAAVGPALVVALLDLQQYDSTGKWPDGQQEELLQLLRRCSSRHPCSVSLNIAMQQQQQRDDTAPAAVAPCVCFVVLCAQHTAQQLLQGMPALQSHCYQLSLPAVQNAEQLAADCKAQLMSTCGWALLEHVRDAHTLAQQQQQMYLGSNSNGSSSGGGSSSRGVSEDLVQPSSAMSGAAAAAAAPAEPAARHLAERLNAALASIHSAVHDAYEAYYLDATCSSRSSSSNGEAGDRLKDHRCVPFSAKQTAALKASQAANIAKPFDVLQLLPVLLSEGRSQLMTRRASLTTCLAKTAKVQQQVQELLQRRKQQQPQQSSTPGASAASAAAAAGCTVAAAAEIEVLSRLGEQVQLLVDKWRAEMEHQVSIKLFVHHAYLPLLMHVSDCGVQQVPLGGLSWSSR
jgi:hypothetical protein